MNWLREAIEYRAQRQRSLDAQTRALAKAVSLSSVFAGFGSVVALSDPNAAHLWLRYALMVALTGLLVGISEAICIRAYNRGRRDAQEQAPTPPQGG